MLVQYDFNSESNMIFDQPCDRKSDEKTFILTNSNLSIIKYSCVSVGLSVWTTVVS